MSLFKTKKPLLFITIAAAVIICFSIVLIIVHGKRNSETPLSLEREHISSIFLEGYSESRFLTESETDEVVRRFNLFDVYKQNNPKYAVSSDLIYAGVSIKYIISFNDKTEITIISFAKGVFNLGGETEIKFRKTVCSAAGVVKNMAAYEEYNGMLFS
ncbi:MAG TPA: hypothetical protein VFD52_02770 [Clostridia bacterium]|jgi:hypothetical protein|nr:hypothetical protein [Clostridia bacterium]